MLYNTKCDNITKYDHNKAIKMSSEVRYRFILLKVYWEGSISRSDLIEAFPIASTQATKDFTALRKLHPTALAYNSSQKRYVPGPALSKIIHPSSLDEYFEMTKPLNDFAHVVKPSSILVVPDIYRSVHRAIKQKTGIEVEYCSLNTPEPKKARTLYPHSVVRSGFRWHVRAYDSQSKEFRDFNLSRIRKVLGESSKKVKNSSIEHDTSWNNKVLLMLTPNMSFTEAQRKVVAQDYTGKDDLAIILKAREAELLYLLHLYEVRDFSDNPPKSQLLQIGNPDDVLQYLPQN